MDKDSGLMNRNKEIHIKPYIFTQTHRRGLDTDKTVKVLTAIFYLGIRKSCL